MRYSDILIMDECCYLEAADDILDDPTLDSCCRRDIEAQRRNSALKAKLLSLDRTNQRLRIQQSTLRPSPPPEPDLPAASHGPGVDDESSLSGSEEDEQDPGVDLPGRVQLRLPLVLRGTRGSGSTHAWRRLLEPALKGSMFSSCCRGAAHTNASPPADEGP